MACMAALHIVVVCLIKEEFIRFPRLAWSRLASRWMLNLTKVPHNLVHTLDADGPTVQSIRLLHVHKYKYI